MIYDSILDTIGNTPVVKLNHISPPKQTVFVKVESFNPMASVKDRLAIAIIDTAEKSGELKPGQTVIEATSGNTGIALAMVCAAKGHPFVATMVETFSIERRKIMKALGAKVILTPALERGSGMVKRAEELAKKHGWFLLLLTNKHKWAWLVDWQHLISINRSCRIALLPTERSLGLFLLS